MYDMEQNLENTNPQLLEYVQQARASGMSEAEIRQELLKNGWPDADITAASGQVLQPIAQVPLSVQAVYQQTIEETLSTKSVSKTKKIILFSVIALLVLGGGYATAAKFVLHTWPFTEYKSAIEPMQPVASRESITAAPGSVPAVGGANLFLKVVDEKNRPITDGIIHTKTTYENGMSGFENDLPIDNIFEDGGLVYWEPPPYEKGDMVFFKIIAVATSGQSSEAWTLNNKDYWNDFTNSTKDYVYEHTFVIDMGKSPPKQSSAMQYKNTIAGFEMTIPSNWEVELAANDICTVSIDCPAEFLDDRNARPRFAFKDGSGTDDYSYLRIARAGGADAIAQFDARINGLSKAGRKFERLKDVIENAETLRIPICMGKIKTSDQPILTCDDLIDFHSLLDTYPDDFWSPMTEYDVFFRKNGMLFQIAANNALSSTLIEGILRSFRPAKVMHTEKRPSVSLKIVKPLPNETYCMGVDSDYVEYDGSGLQRGALFIRNHEGVVYPITKPNKISESVFGKLILAYFANIGWDTRKQLEPGKYSIQLKSHDGGYLTESTEVPVTLKICRNSYFKVIAPYVNEPISASLGYIPFTLVPRLTTTSTISLKVYVTRASSPEIVLSELKTDLTQYTQGKLLGDFVPGDDYQVVAESIGGGFMATSGKFKITKK